MRKYLNYRSLVALVAVSVATASQAALDPAIIAAFDAAQADGTSALTKIFIFCGVLWAGKAVIRKTIGS
ncbi:MAG: hypothetical protein Q7K13_01455 [Polynucleobacter sp.]|uniref:hypothetical protein n=1 Tax=Polynucleobacter sp. TaxID=2029855 RepID=UPI00272863F3|nr:hypothetical protein [Polynucleobacter sp.]MDO8713137.1 hypothetical protein [Polynucleobacter sp.]